MRKHIALEVHFQLQSPAAAIKTVGVPFVAGALMPLLVRIYYHAVFGRLGGLLGWMLFGVLGDKNPSSETAFLFLKHGDVNSMLGGAIIGGIIGYFLVGVEAIRDRAMVKFARLASYGVLLGAIGGALGMYLGDKVNSALVTYVSDDLFMRVLARGIGWILLGMAIGMCEGIAARSLGKFSYVT